MPAFERPSAMSARTSRSRGVSESSGPRAAAGQQLRDDLGVEDRAAGRDPVDGVDEVGHVGHALLEQVADGLRVGRRAARWRSAPRRTATARGPACPAAAGAGRWPPAGPRRCASAACARRRSRCPARSRVTVGTSSSAVPSVATTSSPYSARMRPSPSRRSTESSTITTRTGAPPAASSGRRPGWPGAGCPRRPGPGRPGRPGRRERCTTAPPTPSSVTSTARIGPRRVDPHADRPAPCCAWPRWSGPRRPRSRRVASMAAGGRSGRSTCRSTGTGQRAARAESAASSPRSARTAGWMPRTSSRSSVMARLASSWAWPTRAHGRGVVLAALQALLGQAEVHGQRDEALLRAVVEVALDAAALGLCGVDRGLAALRELLHPLLEHGRAARTEEAADDGAVHRRHAPHDEGA